jgi:hypothetical protein
MGGQHTKIREHFDTCTGCSEWATLSSGLVARLVPQPAPAA